MCVLSGGMDEVLRIFVVTAKGVPYGNETGKGHLTVINVIRRAITQTCGAWRGSNREAG